MKRLSIMHAIRYCGYCRDKLDQPGIDHGVINRRYLYEALSYICRLSLSASEISGAGKLLDILKIIEEGHERSACDGLPARDIPPGCEERIRACIRQKVQLLEFWDPKEKKWEGQDAGLRADHNSQG